MDDNDDKKTAAAAPKRAPKTFAQTLQEHHFGYTHEEATANQTIAVTMTRICQEGYVETDNSCGYPWTKYKLTAKGLEAIQVPACP